MKSEAGPAKGEMLFCFAVEEEAAPLRKLPSEPVGARILITGIGAKNARRSVERALEAGTPALVLTCGFAGALDPSLEIGDVIFSTPDPGLSGALVKLGAQPATFHCASQVVVTAAEKGRLRVATGARAVEMESGVIDEVCRERGIDRRATVRVISDTARQDLPLDFNALMTSGQKISRLKLAGALLSSPKKVPELMSLQRDTRLAAARLAEVIHGLLGAFRSGSVGTIK